MRRGNINKFINEMQLVEWDSVTNNPDTQAAYNEFHRVVKNTINVFHIENWVSHIISIKSIKTKNKLFVNRNKGNDTEERNACYKAYRNRLHHILHTAVRQYYQESIKTTQNQYKETLASDQVNHQ